MPLRLSLSLARSARHLYLLAAGGALASLLLACGSDDPPAGPPAGTEADYHGVGAVCEKNEDCKEDGQECLTGFSGGYCGVKDCQHDSDCPDGSACATLDGATYCFLICVDKIDCNRNRPVDLESNCSANIELVETGKGHKLCVPPSGS